MFDYAANASFYLSRDTLMQYLEERARERGIDIDALVASVEPSGGVSLDGFLELIENNINQGQLRLVFFMEQASPELRSIVAFLNSQMERTEVCLVEAKQFQHGDLRVVVPTLWGYTEQARRIKKSVTVSKSGLRRIWAPESFQADLMSRLNKAQAAEVLSFYKFCLDLPGALLKWGTGAARGSFSVTFPPAIPRSILSVFSDGELCLNFNWLDQSEVEMAVRDQLLATLSAIPALGLQGHDRSRGRTFPIDRWISLKEKIEAAIRSILSEIK